MTRIVTVSGSPFPNSRTQLLAEWLGARVAVEGIEVRSISVPDLCPQELLSCKTDGPTLKAALSLIDQAHGVIFVTPVHKAAYSGALKAFIDVLPQHGLEGKVAFPVAVGGSMAHALAIDYGLWPVLASMNASHVISSVFVQDRLLERMDPRGLKVEADIAKRLEMAIREFTVSLHRHHSGHSTLPPRHPRRDGAYIS
jgi:FMN reductase